MEDDSKLPFLVPFGVDGIEEAEENDPTELVAARLGRPPEAVVPPLPLAGEGMTSWPPTPQPPEGGAGSSRTVTGTPAFTRGEPGNGVIVEPIV